MHKGLTFLKNECDYFSLHCVVISVCTYNEEWLTPEKKVFFVRVLLYNSLSLDFTLGVNVYLFSRIWVYLHVFANKLKELISVCIRQVDCLYYVCLGTLVINIWHFSELRLTYCQGLDSTHSDTCYYVTSKRNFLLVIC